MITTTTTPKRRRVIAALPIGATVYQPAVRLVFVVAWRDGEQSGHEVKPVLGVESLTARRYCRHTEEKHDPDPEGFGDREIIRDGWTFIGADAVHRPVVLDDDGYLVAVPEDGFHFFGSNTRHQLVVCPWAPEQDKERLAPIVGGVLREVSQP